MALQLEYTNPQTGITSNAAYARIAGVQLTHVGAVDSVQIIVDIFHSVTSFQGGFQPVNRVSFETQYDDADSFSFATYYGYLKTLPEFLSAVDV